MWNRKWGVMGPGLCGEAGGPKAGKQGKPHEQGDSVIKARGKGWRETWESGWPVVGLGQCSAGVRKQQ